jgi:hypothetical protein
MDAHILHVVFFATVIALGGLLMWWKKNRKRFACRRMRKHLLKHPSNGIPSDYLLNALEREFKGITFQEYFFGVFIYNEMGGNIAYLCCKDGILSGTASTDKMPCLAKFVEEFKGKPEWQAVSSLMKCGCYCTK